ncbi:MAG: glycosyltransferase family 4 protein [Candidatus Methanomethylicaceae archaeon]
MSKERQQKKILHIIGDSRFGGGVRVILSLIKMAQHHGWVADVLSTDPVVKREFELRGVKVVALPVIWRNTSPVRDCVGLVRLIHFLASSDYSIVHTHTSKGGFIGRLAARMARIPIIIHTVHGFAFHEFSHPVSLYFYSRLERLAAHWCHCIITVSNFHRDWALRLGIAPPDKIIAIPNGISTDHLRVTTALLEMRARLGLSSKDKVILTLGRLFPQKGVEYLIQAMPRVLSSVGQPVVLLIAGEGPLLDNLRGLTEKYGVSQHVRFLGFRKDIGDLLNAADIVVLPSLWEGLSIALLEAMAMAKPIITTAIGSNREVIDDGRNGILVQPADSNGLAQAIISLLSDPFLMLRLGKTAQETFFTYYTEERMLEQTWQVYSDLIRQRMPHAEGLD